jgi:hypothetical protein
MPSVLVHTPFGPEALGFHSAGLTPYQPYNTLDTLITIISLPLGYGVTGEYYAKLISKIVT